jgi:hypothetical protein
MLIEIEDKIISTEVFERKFVCDLNACKGACCVEGDGGAPLTFEEVSIIEENYEKISAHMRPEGIANVAEKGIYYTDEENHPATTLVNGQECSFVYFDESGITKCAIEKAYLENEIDFKKPISCHLYPIRMKKFNEVIGLNYEEWHICKPACACGEKLDVPVFKFLKEPLIRAFGSSFYEELDSVYKQVYPK